MLKVVQSAELNAPRLAADAVGTFNVITGVVVPLATVDDKSVPDVPRVRAATLVTVPLPVPAPRFARAAAAVVAPVPPLATASVPPRVKVPLVVIGPPDKVRPVVPPEPEIEVTVPFVVDVMVIAPLPFVTEIPEPAVIVALVKPPAVLPISNCPLVYDVWPVPPCPILSAVVKPVSDVMSEFAPEPAALRLRRAPDTLVAPVPPFAMASVPPRVKVPDEVTGPPVKERPVVPPDASTDVTVPPPAVDAIVIAPSPFVTLMPEPAVMVALAKLPAVVPINNCPLV